MRLKRLIAIIISCALVLTMVPACKNSDEEATGAAEIQTWPVSSEGTVSEGYALEDVITEDFVYEDFATEEYISESYVLENMIEGDEVCALVIPETVIAECCVYEITVAEDAESQLDALMPPGFRAYDVDWDSVLSKFAAGTAIIVVVAVGAAVADAVQEKASPAVGILAASLKGKATDALKSGLETAALGAVSNVTMATIANSGEITQREVQKYAIEGAADGYFWGVVSTLQEASSDAWSKYEEAAQKVTKRVSDYNKSKKPYENGVRKGLEGISESVNDGVSFAGSEYVYKLQNGKEAIVSILATGSEKNDFKLANTFVKLAETPDGYTWHHVSDYSLLTGKVTLELVETTAHNAIIPHSGGHRMYTYAREVCEELLAA